MVQSKEGGVVLKAEDCVVYLGENFYGYGLTTPLVDPNAPPFQFLGIFMILMAEILQQFDYVGN